MAVVSCAMVLEVEVETVLCKCAIQWRNKKFAMFDRCNEARDT